MDFGELIAEGNTAFVYKNKNKIFKVFKEFLPDSESINEAKKQREASLQLNNVPKVYEVNRVDNKQVIIMEYIEGKPLGYILKNDWNQMENCIKISVDEQIKIHKVVPKNIENMNKKFTRQINEAPYLNSDLKKSLLKKMSQIEFEPKLCHGDFHIYNVIKSEYHTSVIDWVDASIGDMRADVYRSYLLYKGFSEEVAELYLEFYCKESGLRREEILQWQAIVAAARLSETVPSEDTKRLLDIINKENLESAG